MDTLSTIAGGGGAGGLDVAILGQNTVVSVRRFEVLLDKW